MKKYLTKSIRSESGYHPGGPALKNLPTVQETWPWLSLRFNPWIRQIPWRRKQQPTPVFSPGKSCGQRSLVGYSPWGHKESYMTEQLTLQVCKEFKYCSLEAEPRTLPQSCTIISWWLAPPLSLHPPPLLWLATVWICFMGLREGLGDWTVFPKTRIKKTLQLFLGQ